MKKFLRIMVSIAGIAALFTFGYQVVIKGIGKAYVSDINNMYKIGENPDIAVNDYKGLDNEALSSKILEGIDKDYNNLDHVGKTDYDMSTSAQNVMGEMQETLPFLDTIFGWWDKLIGGFSSKDAVKEATPELPSYESEVVE